MVPTGYINLYELNIDRKATNLIYPWVTKDGSLNAFKTVTAQEFAADCQLEVQYKEVIPCQQVCHRTIMLLILLDHEFLHLEQHLKIMKF